MNTSTRGATILVVDDTPSNLSVLLDCLPRHGFKVLVATSGERALEQVTRVIPDLVLLDVVMPGLDGLATCARLKNDPATHDIPIVFMTALSDAKDIVRGFEAGAVDYITKPFRHEEVLARVTTHLTLRRLQTALQEVNLDLERRVTQRTADLEQALLEVQELKNRLTAENEYLQSELSTNDGVIGESPELQRVLHQAEQVAPLDTTVLILGETGTGKELIARALHRLSPRSERPLIKVNCAALPPTLIESELFGHEKGAFTGATQKHLGRFELAAGGTIFLDEIGDLPLELQAKLLRVLQEGEYQRIGGNATLAADTRVIAATNRDLDGAMREGKFREDLFYRLSVFPIEIPPLRERTADIPLLVDLFVKRYAHKIGRPMQPVPKHTMDALCSYHWPGNVRELQNVIERAVILASDGIFRFSPTSKPSAGFADDLPDPGRTLDDVDRQYILRALEDKGWVIDGAKGAARTLGLKPNTLRSKMKKLGIRRPTSESPGGHADQIAP